MSIMAKSDKPLLQLAQPGVHEALAFFGGMILGVFAQIAVRAGLQNFPGQLVAQLIFERGDLVLQFLS